MTKKELHKHGYRYFSGEINLYKLCDELGIHHSKGSNLINSLVDDPTFNMAKCNKTVIKNMGVKLLKEPKVEELPGILVIEEKKPFSTNEDDYGFSQWINSEERKSFVNAGFLFKKWMVHLSDKIMNLKNKNL